MAEPLDEATQNFWNLVAGHDKEAVELSPEVRQALELDAGPEALDDLEAAAGSATDDGSPDPSSLPRADGPSSAVSAPPPEAAALNAHERAPSETPPAPSQILDASSRPSSVDDEPEPGPDEEVPQEPPGRDTHGRIFSTRRAHPLRLRDVLQAKYGDAWLWWEPETLWWAIRRDFGPVGALTRNKIQALRVALKTYSPWCDWDVFEKCGTAWNDAMPIFGAWQPMAPSHLAFTVAVLKELHPEVSVQHEISAYEAMILDDYGFVYAPADWFPGAQVVLDRKAENRAFKLEVESVWHKLAGRDLAPLKWRSDRPLDIHIARLVVVRMYLDGRAALRAGELSAERGVLATTPSSPPVP